MFGTKPVKTIPPRGVSHAPRSAAQTGVGLVIVLAYPPVVLWIPATVLLAERSEAATEGA